MDNKDLWTVKFLYCSKGHINWSNYETIFVSELLARILFDKYNIREDPQHIDSNKCAVTIIVDV